MDTKVDEHGVTIVMIDRDKVICTEGWPNAEDYVKVLNGIVTECHEEGYRQGWRNEIIVNMVVSAYILGLDPMQVLNLLKANELIKDEDDDEWPAVRVQRVADYQDSFSWDWMIDANWWSKRADTGTTTPPVKFVLA